MITKARSGTTLVFVQQVEESYKELGILVSEQANMPIADPFYRSENKWCGEVANDPSCTETPYQEPEASLKPGVISGFTFLVLFVGAAGSFVFYRHKLGTNSISRRSEFGRTLFEPLQRRSRLVLGWGDLA